MEAFKIEKIKQTQTLKECAELLLSVYNSAPWNEHWTYEKALEKLVSCYTAPKFHGWTLRSDEKLLAFCVGNIEPHFSGDYFQLKEMLVSPGSQGQRIDFKLMLVLKEFLKTISINKMTIVNPRELLLYSLD